MSETVASNYHKSVASAYLDGVMTGMIVAVFLALASGLIWHTGMRREAIEAGAGRYDAQTGQFTFGCTGGTR